MTIVKQVANGSGRRSIVRRRGDIVTTGARIGSERSRPPLRNRPTQDVAAARAWWHRDASAFRRFGVSPHRRTVAAARAD
ncbi:hypothetical protein WS70_28360 [Burkholderia mayonis]|uniref:Uncharacterized protein n=1 Tax=Burkholderia mayonis TaxID=1385591 RepID=A0A1B4FPG2_9BURK|nr:hypothetical protein [Burkholderia mayonis]AOJ05574.1 hypothetical protein WS70_28360 [Burkholderia mayonis]KVE45645.1 hypothetical protein WS70_04205 [Burkholderia mayonis]